ncbi:unnamed protein product [Rangifer tarandus platyrhynchus]|uniref:Uncharacterized protein n=1 Tax=Rangifer tarandus platyrhynchus TaxID=3082113 RepID=A0ABN8Z0W9_RANTA|nr:unnamed protein product [Rangifer tarandus platyrhynchus]
MQDNFHQSHHHGQLIPMPQPPQDREPCVSVPCDVCVCVCARTRVQQRPEGEQSRPPVVRASSPVTAPHIKLLPLCPDRLLLGPLVTAASSGPLLPGRGTWRGFQPHRPPPSGVSPLGL